MGPLRKTYFTAFTLTLIIVLAYFPSVSYLLDVHTTMISSSGTIGYMIIQPLHVEGRYIKDDLNNTIYLRGANKGGYNQNPYGKWQRVGYSEPDGFSVFNEAAVGPQYAVMRDDWGFTAMRWTLCIQYWLENTGNYRNNIRRAIEIAQLYGIYIILAPWRVSSADWNHGGMPFPPYDDHSSVIPNEQAFIDFWVDVATYLADLPNWLIDPYNEPHMQTSASHDADRAKWFEVVKDLILAVRQVCDNIVLVQWMEGCWYNGQYAKPILWVQDFIDYLESYGANTNIVISTHNYHDNFGDSYSVIESQFTEIGLKWAATEINYPLIIGETGMASSADQEWFTNDLALHNLWGTSGYLAWTWQSGAGGFSLLQDQPYIPPPSESGQILIDAIASGKQ